MTLSAGSLQTVHMEIIIPKKVVDILRISKGNSHPNACFFSLLTHSKESVLHLQYALFVSSAKWDGGTVFLMGNIHYNGGRTMKSREEVRSIIENAPAARAYNKKPHHFSNQTIGRIFASLLILSGAACLLLTRQVYRVLPYILGGAMAVIGINHVACGLWTKEYQSSETKLTANGIVYFFLGAVILYHHADADAVIGSIWGVLGLMKGSEALNTALYSLSQKKPFAAKAIHAVIELSLGFLLLTDPSSAVAHHVFLLGLELALVGWQILRE